MRTFEFVFFLELNNRLQINKKSRKNKFKKLTIHIYIYIWQKTQYKLIRYFCNTAF